MKTNIISVLQKKFGVTGVSSGEINNVGNRVNDIPLFENCLDSKGHLLSDLELSLNRSSDQDVQDLINSGFYSVRPNLNVSTFENPIGARHVSLSQIVDFINNSESAEQNELSDDSVSSEQPSSDESEPSK